jgi:hypothetical protein
MKKRLKRGLKRIAHWCRQHRHDPVAAQQAALNAKLHGHYEYYGRSSNFRGIQRFYRLVRKTWRTWLNRRTRDTTLSWEQYVAFLKRHPLLKPRITHSWAASRSPA